MLRSLRYLIPIFDPEVRSWGIEARILRMLTFVWLIIGSIALFSASYPEGVSDYNDGLYVIKKQLLWVMVGIICFNLIAKKPIRSVMRLSPWMLFLFLGLILLTSVPGIGRNAGGATRWIPIGPFALQPSEFIKPFLVLQSAQLFGKWEKLSWSIRICWLLIFAFVLLGILKQPNLSTTALCGMTLWLIALAAGLPWISLIITAFGGIGLAGLSLMLNPFQRDRVIFFIDPWQDPQGKGYQLIQSLLAIASGETWGTGFGLSQQKLSYLPIRSTDFIFSVFAEEFGFVGSLVLLLLVISYATVALIVALKCRDRIEQLIAIGIMVLIVGQSLLNIGVATGALPTTGLPLPFFSYGGSSVISCFISAGLLIRVARNSHQADVVSL